MRTFLRMGATPLDEAEMYRSRAAAVAKFERVAHELRRYGQSVEASLHYAQSRAALQEYPDFVLSLGPRGGTKVERA